MPGSRLAPFPLPSLAVVELTYRCTHACVFCSCPWEAPAGMAREAELSLADWRAALELLAARGVSRFAFTGGEPLLKEGALELLRHAAALDSVRLEAAEGAWVERRGPPELSLISNGSAVTAETLAVCCAHRVQLSLSLPGLATYRDHTGAGDPQVILDRFAEARALGVATVVNIAVTRRNLPELYATISAAFLAGAGQLLLNRFLPGGRGLKHAEWMLDADGVREMCDVAEQALTDANRTGTVGTELPRCVVDPARYRRLQVGTRCAAARGFFAVDPSGWVRVCNHSPIRLVRVEEVDRLRDHPYWRKFALQEYLPSACRDCRLAGACDAGCREAAHVTAGAPDGPDPLFQMAGCAPVPV